jgi:hypothetical protein
MIRRKRRIGGSYGIMQIVKLRKKHQTKLLNHPKIIIFRKMGL